MLLNPYLDEFERHYRGGSFMDRYDYRKALVTKYAWAVPNKKAIVAIACLQKPILEIGAGTGYWAWLLKQVGCKVYPHDLCPPGTVANPYNHAIQHTEILPGGAEVVKDYGKDVALMLCWPCYDDPMAYTALNYYRGDTVVYIGEGQYGCTGDQEFHDLLREFYTVEETVKIPQWEGLHDYLSIWKAK